MNMRRPLASQHGSRGFTLVELMVALTIGMFLMIGLISLIVSTTSSRTELDKSTRQIENGRYALQLLSQDIQLAGFTGELSTTWYAQQTPVACISTTSTAADLQYSPSATPGSSTIPMPLYALSAVPTGCNTTITNWLSGTAMLVVSRVDTATTPIASATSAEYYLQVSACGNDALPFALSTGASTAPFNLMLKDCSTSNLALLRKVIHRVYYISSCNVCTPTTKADTTPTLKVAEFVGGVMQVTPLVEGIENLQFDYGIDMDGNGSPDCYVSDPGNTAANPAQIDPSVCPQPSTAYDWTNGTANWSNVMTVRVHVLARSTETSPSWTDPRTYDMGLAASAITPADHYKRHAYSTIVRLYNGSGQRETP
jgi:type IV pilus assembly protein PilW